MRTKDASVIKGVCVKFISQADLRTTAFNQMKVCEVPPAQFYNNRRKEAHGITVADSSLLTEG